MTQQKLSWSLFAAALALFALIYFVERRIPGTAERREPKRLLPLAKAGELRAIEVTLPGRGVVRAERANDHWSLADPAYPARENAIETLATNLVEARAIDRIPPHDANLEGQKAFGLEPPRAVVDLNFAGNAVRLEIGGVAPLSSNVYVRLPRSGEIFVASASILEGLPRTTNDWRSPALFQLSGLDFDRIQVTAGQRSFELSRSPTNNIWQITRPIPARADQGRVLELLQVLRSADASGFVIDSPGADLDRYGLQTPAVEVSFSNGTNRIYSIEFGSLSTNVANLTNQVFARLIGPKNVVLVPGALAEYLKQPYKAFHDPRLARIVPAQLDRIVVQAREQFVLQRQPRGDWVIEDAQKTPVDPELLSRFAQTASSLQIVDIVKEVPTDADLKSVGLLPPIASYAFFEKQTNINGLTTNILFSQLNFGGAQTDKVFVRRSDETPIYLTQLAALLELPKRAFQLRDRRIWRFDTNSVVSLALATRSDTNQIARTGAAWSNDPLLNAQIDEVVFRLSRLNAQEWVDKGAAKLATFGVAENAPKLIVKTRTLAAADSYTLQFGRLTLRRDVYAAMTFPGDAEPTLFEFPGDLYQLLLQVVPAPR